MNVKNMELQISTTYVQCTHTEVIIAVGHRPIAAQ